MEAPNRVSGGRGRFSLQLHCRDDHILLYNILGCRHGLVLIFLPKRRQILVWDPVTSDQHLISPTLGFPQLFLDGAFRGAVLRAAGDDQRFQFQVVIVGTVEQQDDDYWWETDERAVARVYSSETGTWGNLTSTPLPPMKSSSTTTYSWVPDVLVGNSLYLLLGKSNILEFDLDMQRLALISLLVEVHTYAESNCEFLVMRADGGGLGCLVLSKFSAQLWRRKTDGEGLASWVLGRTIELDKILSLNTDERSPLKILGFAEDNSMVLLGADMYRYTIQLQSLQFKKFAGINFRCSYHPFESVYTGGRVNGGEHDRAELLDKT